MILELKYVDTGSKKGIEVHDKEKLTIKYNSYADIEEQKGTIERFKTELSTLVIWGTHGSASNLCNLTAEDIKSLVRALSGFALKFNTIVLDACESALYAEAFASLLSEKGIVLCHMGICPMQVMTFDNIQESEIRIKWKKIFDNLKEDFSFPIKMAVFPATYQKPQNMHHLIIDGMLCECTVEEKKKYPEKYKNLISPADLDKNVGNTKSCVVTDDQAFFKFMD